ncbi:MAG: hypothetical protein HZC44_08665 [Geobacter sp.]|nr:hypothetical protein [Geobacter sp.]
MLFSIHEPCRVSGTNSTPAVTIIIQPISAVRAILEDNFSSWGATQEEQDSARMQISQPAVCKHANMMGAAETKGHLHKKYAVTRATLTKKGDLLAALSYEMQASI